jgi:hypothetical protein
MFPEMSVEFRRISHRYIPEDGTLSTHRCENLRSYQLDLCSQFWNYLTLHRPPVYCIHVQTSAAVLKPLYFAPHSTFMNFVHFSQ